MFLRFDCYHVIYSEINVVIDVNDPIILVYIKHASQGMFKLCVLQILWDSRG